MIYNSSKKLKTFWVYHNNEMGQYSAVKNNILGEYLLLQKDAYGMSKNMEVKNILYITI